MLSIEEKKEYKRNWAKNKRDNNPDFVNKTNEAAKAKRIVLNKRGEYLKKFDLVGKRFSRLTVLSKASTGTKFTATTWLCKCDCGNEKVINGNNLRMGYTKSCGCLRVENSGILNLIHGDTHSKEYNAWLSMKARCYKKTNRDYPNYGGRGIFVCDRWLYSYTNFLEDMGRSPSADLELDRIEVNGIYEKDNCRWATEEVQANNKRNNHLFTYNGETMTLAQWTRKLNIGKWWFYNTKYKNNPEKVMEKFFKPI